SAKKLPGDLLQNSVMENVRLSVEKIETASPILTPLIESGTVKVVGGKYDLVTGEVTLYTGVDKPA
ncbi:MAG: carbonic anhydrase, partial [Candidatus Dadabacteria bacterium]